ncbi:ribose ABC transport system, periplasmic ribose-binding protein RbsB [Klebsiella pneumoniae]|uniref:Ribose ABC transport system, periplasmic ribose-binding protein RbsB n=1 Tax=Klebsiella pneumoniae TaxID=573 RepID=A0A378AYF6_KLEPN|nr:ribose ABC transport system, periplasmic ribose-binding protein RbsB [Klebsiella pneumoniae]
MKHCKIILLVGLLASSASALAEKIGVSMAYFDQNFLTIIRQSIEKEAQAATSTYSLKTPAATPDARPIRCRASLPPAWTRSSSTRWTPASTPQLTKMAQQAKMPLVYVNRTPGDKTLPPGVVFVGSDERESGTLQMEALAKLAKLQRQRRHHDRNLTDAGALQRTKDVSRWWPSIRQ